MKFTIPKEDKLKVLTTTKPVVENSKYVFIREEGIEKAVNIISKQLSKNGLNSTDLGVETTGDFIKDVQLIFLQDVVNFCYWAEKDKPKWEIEWPKGSYESGGYGMVISFKRALSENVPILDSNYLQTIDIEKTKHFFRSSNGVEIPLIEERFQNLKEAGIVLKERFDGQFINILEESNFDAVELVNLVIKFFPSFRDIYKTDNGGVYFLKRAQIVANDISLISNKISNIDKLTAFADYKVPQSLRKLGVIEYSEDLARKLDNYELIPYGSQEEIEIRAATVWSVNLIADKLKNHTSAEIDNALWLIGQDKTGLKPYHRTYTIFY